jgi:tetratricopeptide (TPR) repeat protein
MSGTASMFGTDAMAVMARIGVSVAGACVPFLLCAKMVLDLVSTAVTEDTREPEAITQEALKMARLKLGKGDVEGALQECDMLAADLPDEHVPLVERVRILESAKRYEEAVDEAKAIMQRFRMRDVAWLGAASYLELITRHQLKDIEQADFLQRQITERKKAMEPGQYVGENIEGAMAMDAARRASKGGDEGAHPAIKRYREAFKNNPDDPRPLLGAVALLDRDGEFTEAVDALQFVMRKFEDDEEVWADAAFRLGKTYEQHMDNNAGAAKMYREIIKRRPVTEHLSLARERLAEIHKIDSDL